MKPNTAGGAGHHNAEGIPTGLDRKARRAIHAARDEIEQIEPERPPNVGKLLLRADEILTTWTEGKLDSSRTMIIVDDAYRRLRNSETDPKNVTSNYGRPFGP